MGDVVFLESRREKPLNYRELATSLGVSVRWLKYRKADGMPDAGLNWKGERAFLMSEVRPWLDGWAAERGRVVSPASESTDRGSR